jgi:amphi-Trp domain-containing protein
MSRGKREFAYESLQDRSSIVKYLRALADGFERGELSFSDKSGEVTLEPKGLIGFEVRASKKSDRTRLTVNFRWKNGEDATESETGPLFITVGSE